MSKKEHAGSFILPVVVMIFIPWLIMWLSNDVTIGWSLVWPLDMAVMLSGIVVLFIGLFLLGICIRMFATIGQGTLAPWAPTQKLVVVGIYRYMRNPMIAGVLIGLLGESIILSNSAVFLWFVIAFIGNHIYFIKSEEPGLVKRFGEEFIIYRENVPRWIPRRKPWTPSGYSAD